MKRHYIIYSLLFSLLGLCSCEYKDLDEYVPVPSSVLLDYSWENVDSMPQTFRVVFYPADEETNQKVTQGYIVYDVFNKQTLLSDFPTGTYNVTLWNTDTEHNVVENFGKRNNLLATAPVLYTALNMPISVLDSIYNGQSIYDTPDYMVHANETMFTVEKDEENQLLTLHPDSLVVDIEYRIHGVAGLQIAKDVKATLNNIAMKRFIAYDNSTKDTCVVMTNCKFNKEDSLIYGSFYVYGIHPTDMKNVHHKMILFFWLESKNIYIPIDITNAMQSYSVDDKKILIDIPNLDIDLRKYVSGSGSFNVDVDSWEDVNIDIPW